MKKAIIPDGIESAAWKLYCSETAGDMDVKDSWSQLTPQTRNYYREKILNTPSEPTGYEDVARIYSLAVDQTQNGKGKERHAHAGESFKDQQICKLNKWCSSGAIFQACKKAMESGRLPKERAIAELLGAMNYLAAEVLRREEELETTK